MLALGAEALVTLSKRKFGPTSCTSRVRSRLRDEYGIEAAVGGFGEHGGFLRLSHAVYTTDDDLGRLRDAVSELSRRP